MHLTSGKEAGIPDRISDSKLQLSLCSMLLKVYV